MLYTEVQCVQTNGILFETTMLLCGVPQESQSLTAKTFRKTYRLLDTYYIRYIHIVMHVTYKNSYRLLDTYYI